MQRPGRQTQERWMKTDKLTKRAWADEQIKHMCTQKKIGKRQRQEG